MSTIRNEQKMLNFKNNKIKNICFIGLMGSGKSIIGRDLSKIYNVDFVDSDTEIEKELGQPINIIFENHGEKYFRSVEEIICLKILNKDNCIISLGGGSILSLKIRNMIKKNSYSIYLKVKKEIILQRLKISKKRPLLNNVDKQSVINKIYSERKIFYDDANFIVSNDIDKKDIVLKIKNHINSL